MKKILILGAGLVAGAHTRYLLKQPDFHVTVASRTLSKAQDIVKGYPNGEARQLNVNDEAALEGLISQADLSVSLLPYAYHPTVARLCIKHHKHMVTTSYVKETMAKLDGAAKEAGVRRIVYASTCHVVHVKTATHAIDADDPLQPDSMYGASKAFGEVLGRFYHDRFGIEFAAIRIGWLLPYDDPELRTNDFKRRIWLSHRDGIALFRLAIEKPGIGCAVVHGTSLTSEEILSLRSARDLLGYHPQDDVVALYGPGPDAEPE